MRDVKCIGLDVHKTSISAAVLDVSGKLVMQAVFMTKAAAILGFLRGISGILRVTFEEGTHAAGMQSVAVADFGSAGVQSAQECPWQLAA